MGVLPTKKDKEVYESKIGDVIAFHGNSTFQACYAIVVSEDFFKRYADKKMKEIFEWCSSINDDKQSIFILRINNGTDAQGRSVFIPAFLFVDCYEYKFTFLYSVFDGRRRKIVETIFDSFNNVFVTEYNRGRSPYYHIFESLKEISEHVKEKRWSDPKNLYGHFIFDLQKSRNQKSLASKLVEQKPFKVVGGKNG